MNTSRINYFQNLILLNRQNGSTLIVSLILLFAITMITIYSSKSAVIEQRLSKNETNTIQALHASDAGLEIMLANMIDKTQRATLLTDANADGQPDGVLNGTLGANGQTYNVTLSSPTANDFSKIVVQSIGCSDACPGTCSTACPFHKVVQQELSTITATNTTPNAPLIARDFVDIPSSTEIINDYNAEVIHCGGAYTDNPATRIKSLGVYVSTTPPTAPSIVEGDSALNTSTTDNYFKTFFNVDKTDMQQMSGVLDCSAGCGNTEITTAISGSQLVWASGDVTLTGNNTFGTQANPIILIVDGNLALGGHVVINGLVYVTASPKWDDTGNGNANIFGAAIAEHGFHANGNLTVTYDPTALTNVNKIILGVAKVSGSWIDF